MATNFILSQGGIGDAFLTIAASYEHDKCRVVHAAAQTGVYKVLKRIFSLFDLEGFEVLPRPFTIEEYCLLRYSRNCVSATYLPDDLEWSDWAHFGKYQGRVSTKLPVQEIFGRRPNPRDTHRVVVLAPAGSNSPPTIPAPWGMVTKQRYIRQQEFSEIVSQLLEKCTVYCIGSPKDRATYGVPDSPHFYWATFDDITCGDGTSCPSDIPMLFSIINGADLVVSSDTWVKTYSCMAKLPTIVTRTRYEDQYYDYREVQDWGENIFLNLDLWDIDIVEVEKLIETPLLFERLGLSGTVKRTRYI